MVQNILRIFLGLMLLFSGIIKLYPIEYFENLILTHDIVGIFIAPYLARFLISAELFLGLCLAFSFTSKWVIRASMTMIIGYTVWLSYLWLVKGETENCGCFGDKIIMTPAQATFKNLITLVLLFMLQKGEPFRWFQKFKKWIIGFFTALSLSLPFILTPVIFAKPQIFEGENRPVLSLEELTSDSLLIQELNQGKKIIAFFLSSCDHCELAAQRIEAMQKENHWDIHAFIYNSQKTSASVFLEKTQISYSCTLVDSIEKMLPVAGSRFPSILVVDNGRVEKQLGFYDLEELVKTP